MTGSSRRHFLPILLVAAFGLALLRLPAIAASNQENLVLVESVCGGEGCGAAADLARVSATLPGAWQEGADLEPCQQLWLAGVYASEDAARALRALDESGGCSRRDLYVAWGAAVYDALGMPEKTISMWASLPPATLIQRAGALVAAGRVAEGKRLLEIVATRAPGNMSANEQYALNVALGDLYRSEQNWHNAAQAYRSALSAGPRTEDLLYLLGMSLREAGLNEEALTVLGEGLLILQTDRPYFVSSFYIQLGLTQASLGYNSEAILSLQKAKEWELREFSPNPDQLDFIGRQIVEVGSQ